MEHVTYHSIMSHLNRNDVLSGSQHGFRAGYSCSTQLISLIEDLNFHMDHNVQVDMILLDFSKAFDTVPHCCLLKKLKFYHIDNQVIQWIEKCLTLRKQRVQSFVLIFVNQFMVIKFTLIGYYRTWYVFTKLP